MSIKVKSFEELGSMFQRKVEKKALPFGTITNSQGLTSELKTRPLFEKTDKGHVLVGKMTVLDKPMPLRQF